MTRNNPYADFFNNNAFIKLRENMSNCSQDFERKRNSGVNQGHIFLSHTHTNDRLISFSHHKFRIFILKKRSIKMFLITLRCDIPLT